ncbi:hypothetical protein MIR68_008343 [Amoeboaphelidium protococcarum]|nr:hypothetical protein MIR68_008343 [Amoeboaphelidium protococcarum]
MSASQSSQSSEESSFEWVREYLQIKGTEYFCEVDQHYILDKFNLTGLNYEVAFFNPAYDLICDKMDEEQAITSYDLAMNNDQQGGSNGNLNVSAEDIQQELIKNARHLYGLIHARYILTTKGLYAMQQKFKSGHFGRCPRVWCQGQALLPVGLTDVPGQLGVKLYCAKCEDVYDPKSKRHLYVDGAYFTTTFPHLFLQQYPQYIPTRVVTSGQVTPSNSNVSSTSIRDMQNVSQHSNASGDLESSIRYVPRIYGFKIRDYSKVLPQIPQSIMEQAHQVRQNEQVLQAAMSQSVANVESNQIMTD